MREVWDEIDRMTTLPLPLIQVVKKDSEFASDLRFPVGKWPTATVYHDRTYNFSRVERDNEGDIIAAIYEAPGRMLTVFNT